MFNADIEARRATAPTSGPAPASPSKLERRADFALANTDLAPDHASAT
jgi:hypothetical protein